jgi:hypothetical protein
MPSRLCCKPVEVMIIAMVAPLGAGGREEQAGRLAVRAGKSHCWIGHRRIISASAENRGNSCQRKHPAEILALGPSCASHRRSSNTNSLCGRNLAGSPEICATFSKGYFATTFLEFESSHLSHAVGSLWRVYPVHAPNEDGITVERSRRKSALTRRTWSLLETFRPRSRQRNGRWICRCATR